MNEQYYYWTIYYIQVALNTMLSWWYKFVLVVHTYPALSITIMLIGFLILIFMAFKRNIKVTVIEGEELHNLVRAMREPKQSL